ncbi:hypothetical protein LCGC14_2960170 [marine sediment metagenome]|uniref:Uncharacterized protein n=1 Tax=marine sediment metagenome TaxID=412755 RepID=A0A0F8XCB6_9ZZZZ
MKRYYLSTPIRTMTVAVDEQNIVKNVKSFQGDAIHNIPMDDLLDLLREEGQVEMMEI